MTCKFMKCKCDARTASDVVVMTEKTFVNLKKHELDLVKC